MPHAGGRPPIYDPDETPKLAHKLALLGLTNAEMADIFEVDERTIVQWTADHAEFSLSIARGRIQADAKVADRLYNRALGYSHDAVKIFMPAGAEAPVYAPYTEHYPPDTQAASLWLRNRQPKRWRDKTEVEHSGEIGLAERLVAARTRALSPPTIEHEALPGVPDPSSDEAE